MPIYKFSHHLLAALIHLAHTAVKWKTNFLILDVGDKLVNTDETTLTKYEKKFMQKAVSIMYTVFSFKKEHGRCFHPKSLLRWSKSTLKIWPDLSSLIFILSFIKRSLSLGLILNLNTLPDEDMYFWSSRESYFMARLILWLVGIRTSGDSRRWHLLLLTSSTQSPPQRNTSDMADITSSHQ